MENTTEQQEVKEQVIETVKKEPKPQEESYVKHRVERAKETAQKNIFNSLGVSSLEEIQTKLTQLEKLEKQLNDLTSKLEENELLTKRNNKRNLLKSRLDQEKVFDSEALLHYVDIDKVEIENDTIKNGDEIIKELKEKKPNFFSTEKIVSDKFVNNVTVSGAVSPMEEAYNRNDNRAVFIEYLRQIGGLKHGNT